jgi:ATP-dependent DNA ligase
MLLRSGLPLPAGFIAPCLPTSAPRPPSGALWLHEIKHDGFRIVARKDGNRVRLYSRPGNDLTKRFPLIVDTLAGCAHGPASSTGRRWCAALTGLPVSR